MGTRLNVRSRRIDRVLDVLVHEREQGRAERLEELGCHHLLACKQLLHVAPFLGFLKARWAVLVDDWQAGCVRKVPRLLLPSIGEWANDAKVPLVYLVVRFHGVQPSVEHGRHHEALGEVVQVLAQHKNVLVVLPAARVERPTLHARTERADGVALQRAASRGVHDLRLDVVVFDA
eukprot:scaffold4262_cov328-Prasinococcus_capsulatus_cf.AAC.5